MLASPEDLQPYLQFVRSNNATTNREMTTNFFVALAKISNGWPYYDDNGVGACPLLFYGYSPTSNDGEVRDTLFANEDGTYTHALLTDNGRFVQQSGLNSNPSSTLVSISLFAKDLVKYTFEGFEVIYGEKAEDLDSVLARSLWFYYKIGLPPVFMLDVALKR